MIDERMRYHGDDDDADILICIFIYLKQSEFMKNVTMMRAIVVTAVIHAVMPS